MADNQIVISVVGEDALTPIMQGILDALASLNEAVDNLAAQIDEAFSGMGEAVDGFAAQVDNLDTAAATFDGVGTSMVDALDAMTEALAATDEAAASAATSVSTMATTTAGAAATTGGAAAGAAGFGGLSLSFGQIIQYGTLAATAVSIFGAKGLQAADKFEVALARVKGLTGQTKDTMVTLEAEALQLSQAFGVDPAKIADGFYFLLSAGVKLSDVMSVMTTIMKGSIGAMVDQATYANLLTGLMANYGMSAADAARDSDILIQMIVKGKTSADAMVASFGRMLVGTTQGKVPIEEMAAAFDLLTIHTYTARQAETNLGTLMSNVTTEFAKFEDRVGKAGDSLNKAKFEGDDFKNRLLDLWNAAHQNSNEFRKFFTSATDYKTALVLIGDGGKAFHDMLGNFKGDLGTTQNAYDAFKVTTQQALNSVGASWDRFVHGVHMAIKPQLDATIRSIGGFFDSLIPMFKAHGAQIVDVLKTIGLVIGALLVPAIVGMLSALGGALIAAAPFIALGLAIKFLIPYIQDAWKHSASFRDAVHGIVGAVQGYISTVAPAFLNFWKTIQPLLSTVATVLVNDIFPAVVKVFGFLLGNAGKGDAFILNLASTITNILGEAFKVLGILFGPLIRGWQAMQKGSQDFDGVMKQLVGGIDGILKPLGGMKEIFAQVGEASKNLAPIWEFLAKWVGILAADFSSILMPVLFALGKAFGVVFMTIGIVLKAAFGVIVGFLQIVIGIIGGLINLLADLVTGHFDKMGKHLSQMWTMLWHGIVNILKSIGIAIIAVVSGLVGAVIAFFVNLVKGVVSWVTHLWSELVGHSIIPDMVLGILKWIARLPIEVVAFIVHMVMQFLKWVRMLEMEAIVRITAMFTGMLHSVEQGAANIWNGAKNLVTNVLKSLGDLITQGPEIVGHMMDGMMNAVKNMGANVINGAKQWAGNLLGSIGNALGIHSPSVHMHNMGVMMMQGLVNGLRSIDVAAEFSKHFGTLHATATLAHHTAGGVALAGSAANGEGGNGTITVNLNMQGGLGAGLQLLNPTDRRRFVQQVAQELSNVTHGQAILNTGYTGH